MIIKGFQKLTLIDFPGQVASTIFVGGCNFACGYCYNQDLVLGFDKMKTIPEEEIFAELDRRRKMIDGVVLCGGEPTIYPDIGDFAKKCKDKGLLIKLDTNGSNPDKIKEMIDLKLVDYIAMDIKAPLDEYERIVGVKVDIEKIKKSIKIIMASGLDYEFRTTFVPGFHNSLRVKKMAESISGAKKYYLQMFRPEDKIRDPQINKEKPFTREQFDEFLKIAKEFVNCELRI